MEKSSTPRKLVPLVLRVAPGLANLLEYFDGNGSGTMRWQAYLPSIGQGGLGLPDRDYFLVDDPAFAKARDAYKAHLGRMFGLAGMSDPQGRAARVYALEERIAKGHWTRAEQRNPDKTYNLFTRAELAAKAPGLDWAAFLDAAGFASAQQLLVSQPSAITTASLATREVALQDWKDYLAFRSIRAFAPFGPKALVAENFDFQSRTLAGTPEMPAPWKTASALTDQAIGHAVGAIYLKEYFPAEARATVEQMTGEIKAAMGRRINALTWMAPETKARALKKLAAVQVQIGAQTPPKSYDALPVVRGAAVRQCARSGALRVHAQCGQAGDAGDTPRLGDAGAHRQCAGESGAGEDHVSRRHHAGAVLRSGSRPGDQLRRDRRRDGSRAQSRLRRPGVQVR